MFSPVLKAHALSLLYLLSVICYLLFVFVLELLEFDITCLLN